MVSFLRDSPVAMQTLVFVAVVHEGSDNCPFFGMFAIEIQEDGILLLGPGFDFSLFGVQVLLLDFHADSHSIGPLDRHSILSLTNFFHYIYRR